MAKNLPGRMLPSFSASVLGAARILAPVEASFASTRPTVGALGAAVRLGVRLTCPARFAVRVGITIDREVGDGPCATACCSPLTATNIAANQPATRMKTHCQRMRITTTPDYPGYLGPYLPCASRFLFAC